MKECRCAYGLQVNVKRYLRLITVSNNEMKSFESITILTTIDCYQRPIKTCGIRNHDAGIDIFPTVALKRGLFMCAGYELLLLPNKMPRKTPNREMSVDSCFLCFS